MSQVSKLLLEVLLKLLKDSSISKKDKSTTADDLLDKYNQILK